MEKIQAPRGRPRIGMEAEYAEIARLARAQQDIEKMQRQHEKAKQSLDRIKELRDEEAREKAAKIRAKEEKAHALAKTAEINREKRENRRRLKALELAAKEERQKQRLAAGKKLRGPSQLSQAQKEERSRTIKKALSLKKATQRAMDITPAGEEPLRAVKKVSMIKPEVEARMLEDIKRAMDAVETRQGAQNCGVALSFEEAPDDFKTRWSFPA